MFRAIQNYYTFHPERASAGDVSRFHHTEKFLKGPDGDIHIRYRMHDLHAPFVLFSHGNSSCIEGLAPTYDFYELLGVSYLAYDYPGYGKSGGTPSEESLYRSFDLVYSFVRDTLAVPEKTLYLHGLSLGGAVTIRSLPSVEVAGAILESTFTSSSAMAGVLFPRLPFLKYIIRGFDSLERIQKAKCELLFIHGEQDPTIPCEHSERLAQNATAKTFTYIIPNCGHADQKERGGERYQQIWQTFLAGGVDALQKIDQV